MSDFIEKRHVRLAHPSGHEAHDYVPVDILDAYLADARQRWEVAEVVKETHDAGPAGDDGLTHYPDHISHPLQGKTVDRFGNIQEG
jgi:hypothetical protein